jgi:hypothetical protein
MVTRRQLDRLANKFDLHKIVKPAILMQNESGQLIDTKTKKEISESELEKLDQKSKFPTVILVRGEESGN